jgi:hypothetical protein
LGTHRLAATPAGYRGFAPGPRPTTPSKTSW